MELDLSAKGINDEDAIKLAIPLYNNTSLKSLKLDSNLITATGIKALSESLKYHPCVDSLSLAGNNHSRQNQIGDDGAAWLANALKANQSLRFINLWGNNVGYIGTKAFAEALKENNTLIALRLSDANIGDNGAQEFADALRINKKLSILILEYGNIGDIGGRQFADALRINMTLSTLILTGNRGIGVATGKDFTETLNLNSCLSWLKIDEDRIGYLKVQIKNCIDRNVERQMVEANNIYEQAGKLLTSDLPEDTTNIIDLLTSAIKHIEPLEYRYNVYLLKLSLNLGDIAPDVKSLLKSSLTDKAKALIKLAEYNEAYNLLERVFKIDRNYSEAVELKIEIKILKRLKLKEEQNRIKTEIALKEKEEQEQKIEQKTKENAFNQISSTYSYKQSDVEIIGKYIISQLNDSNICYIPEVKLKEIGLKLGQSQKGIGLYSLYEGHWISFILLKLHDLSYHKEGIIKFYYKDSKNGIYNTLKDELTESFINYELELIKLGSKAEQLNDSDSGIFALRNLTILAKADVGSLAMVKFYEPKGMTIQSREATLIHDREELAGYYVYAKLQNITEWAIKSKLLKLHQNEVSYLQNILYEIDELFEELDTVVELSLTHQNSFYSYKIIFNNGSLEQITMLTEAIQNSLLGDHKTITLLNDSKHYYFEIGNDSLKAGKEIKLLNDMRDLNNKKQQSLMLTNKEQASLVNKFIKDLSPNTEQEIGFLKILVSKLKSIFITVTPTLGYEVDVNNLSYLLGIYDDSQIEDKKSDEKINPYLAIRCIFAISDENIESSNGSVFQEDYHSNMLGSTNDF